MILLLAMLVAAGAAAVLTRGGISRRLPAALIPVALWLLATRPDIPWPSGTPVVLSPHATLAEIEATVRRTAPSSVVRVQGNGVHPDFVPLLADRQVNWEPPDSRLGLRTLSWPRRVAIGEPVAVSGRLDVAEPVTVRLITPEGRIDSTTTSDAFDFRMIPSAAGRWRMLLVIGPDTMPLGLHVVQPPRLRVMVIAGRPGFEVPALVRRLSAQGADVTVRTQMTRDRRRTERIGLTPLDDRLASVDLDSVDLVVLAADGAGTLSSAEQRALAAAVERGLGLLHVTSSALRIGPLTPFALRQSGTEWDATVAIDQRPMPGVARVSPLAGDDSLAYLRDTSGRALGWRVRVGEGVVAATALTLAHRFSLSGHPDTEAEWWSALLGPVLRVAAGRWTVPDDALIRADEPVRLSWSGRDEVEVVVAEREARSQLRLSPSAPGDPMGLRLWPRDSGWLSVAALGDTLHLLVADHNAFPGVAGDLRRQAMERVAPVTTQPGGTGRVAFPLPLAGLLLLAAIAAAWRPR